MMMITSTLLSNKKKLIIPLIIVLSFIFTSCSTGSKDKPVTANHDVDIKSTIQEYIAYISNKNWENALEYLSGQALAITKNNLAGSNDIKKIELDTLEVDTVMQTDSHAIAEVKIVTKDGTMIQTGDYRYFLFMDDKRWKIYDIETINKLCLSNQKESDKKAEEVVKSYLENISSGDYENAIKHLTSPALENARIDITEKIPNNPSISDISVKTVYNSENTALIEAKYITKTQEQSKITAMFTIAYLPEPLISNIKIVKLQ
jgi:hypothetical protein